MAATILIADTDRELCAVYRRFFSCQGWHVQSSDGGLECLAQLRQYSPHLLILDLQLPWGGADGVLALMRADPGLARVPVILTTTELSPQALARLVAPPVVHALTKPISLSALLDLVRSGLGNGWSVPSSESREQASPGRCS